MGTKKQSEKFSCFYRNLPETPGVYLMKNAAGKILYIGKAVNLRRRVASYFTRPHEYRIARLVHAIKKVDYRRTDTTLEALILESALIKRYQPPYNVREKDDASFLFVEITRDEFPHVLLVRGKSRPGPGARRFGPFLSAKALREALRILRRILIRVRNEAHRFAIAYHRTVRGYASLGK